MSGAGNYCRTDSAVPQSAAGAGPRSSTGLGEWRGWGPWGLGGGGGGGVVAPDPRAYILVNSYICIHTYMHTCMHTYIHTYVHACIPIYIHVCSSCHKKIMMAIAIQKWQAMASANILFSQQLGGSEISKVHRLTATFAQPMEG